MIVDYKIYVARDGDKTTLKNSTELANSLSLEITDEFSVLSDSIALFEYQQDKLFLNILLEGKATHLGFDLVEGELGFRASRVSKSNELIARAIGCKPHYRPRVLDATAGMGRDALIMALLGCPVTMYERNLAIFQLLKNALMRFTDEEEFSEVSEKLKLSRRNSFDFLETLKGVDVIYLDPMFPSRKKSALVKKEMRLFKLLAGEDTDADRLLTSALQSRVQRVVVKRPKGAPELANKKPSHKVEAKKFRYDVYLKTSVS